MNLLRIILILFAVYFFRRIYQFYKFVKKQNQLIQQRNQEQEKKPESIDAEYRVID
ncbi:MAG TPA: hypothetical protein VKY27_07275 [Bacteriovoracaceae bacterium]|nr:hypothetical protein [Bacteriovoracaceae bacterium]